MSAIAIGRIGYQARRFPAIWIPVAYALALVAVSQFHSVFDEWGGVMQFFAGKEILAGMGYHGWASYFWPPLFSFLIGIGSLLLPGFVAGKLISILAASALLFVAFHFAEEISQRRDVGWWSQIFMVVSPIYVSQSLLAHNHMLNSLFFVAGLYLFLRALRDPKRARFLISGLVCGLAALTRYTSYVLVALPLSVLFLRLCIRRAGNYAGAFWIGFSVVCLPWWYANTIQNGSPFYSFAHLNICTAVIAHNPGTNRSLWWCAAQGYQGVTDIVAAYPLEYVRNFAHNILASIKLLLREAGVLAPFVLPAFFESVLMVHPTRWLPLFGTLSLSICLVSQAFVNEWFLLSWTIPMILISVLFVFKYLGRVTYRFSILNKYHVRTLCLSFLAIAGLALTVNRLVTWLNAERTYAPLADAERVTQALKAHDPALESKIVMAIDPGRAYYAGSRFLITPLDYQGTVQAMVSYGGISEQLKEYAPKFPSTMRSTDLRADYLIYANAPVNWTQEFELPQFAFLLDPQSAEIPANFEAIYRSERVVAYEIHW